MSEHLGKNMGARHNHPLGLQPSSQCSPSFSIIAKRGIVLSGIVENKAAVPIFQQGLKFSRNCKEK